jgi:hypothetical protein
MKRLIVTLTLLLGASIAGAQISPQFFGLHTGSVKTAWPTVADVQFASWRSNAAMVRWSDINTAPGVYDWTRLDNALSSTTQYGQSVLYNVYYTPSWASQCPACVCGKQKETAGCYPPSDLNSDGSGTDQHLKDFVAALLQHAGPGKISYLEVWNEPNIIGEFNGTIEQLVRMASDVQSVAKSFDPNIQIISPAETGDGPPGTDQLRMTYLDQFLAAGGGAYVDIIALHGYVGIPEDIIQRVNSTIAVMQKYGQGEKPIFVTEGSWATVDGHMPVEMEPGFSFRHYLSMLSTPVQRFYLFSFDAENLGNLWSDQQLALTPNGIVYQRYYSWLVGATMAKPCQPQSPGSSIWSCNFTKPPNVRAQVIWNTGTLWGQTTTVTVPNAFGEYLDLYGNTVPIENHQVPISYDPIVLIVKK